MTDTDTTSIAIRAATGAFVGAIVGVNLGVASGVDLAVLVTLAGIFAALLLLVSLIADGNAFASRGGDR